MHCSKQGPFGLFPTFPWAYWHVVYNLFCLHQHPNSSKQIIHAYIMFGSEFSAQFMNFCHSKEVMTPLFNQPRVSASTRETNKVMWCRRDTTIPLKSYNYGRDEINSFKYHSLLDSVIHPKQYPFGSLFLGVPYESIGAPNGWVQVLFRDPSHIDHLPNSSTLLHHDVFRSHQLLLQFS